MAERIRCDCCKGTGTKCGHCGGFGYLIESRLIPCCSRQVWVRPGAFAAHASNQYRTFNGILMIRQKSGDICSDCYAKDLGKKKKPKLVVLEPKD